MDRLTRLTSILIQLQSRKIIIAKEIANRFDISLRTVYRDIKTLQEAGVPIGSENGKGYFLVDGYHLPPIMLTEEEVNTLVVAEKLINNQGDDSLRIQFNSLLFKIKSVLKDFQKENYEKLEKRIAPSYLKVPFESNSLSDFKNAITKNQKVEIIYHSISKDEISKRIIDPQGVYFSNNAWVLVAHCNTKNEQREFRLDRIQSYKTTSDKFVEKTDFDLTKYFLKKYKPS
ncbi:YafY family protein [Mangrovivirga sp. M17]|uniref:YafY family protein n=1 Tax=Mangrovivirga halotolerans TaxID=2993936 RepID=A0ABT3RNF4_9BACT|nr:YafY family protein [Mangrovivirga halotolerans]MCX2743339.1 YafY family protein [Mangrovivirga halotolerans]